MDNINLIYPELFLSISLLSLLMLGVFKKNSFLVVSKLTSIVLLLTIPLIYINDNTSEKLFNNNYLIDEFSSF